MFVEFGDRGVTSASFTLSDPASSQPVLLNLVGGQAFGFRLDTPDDKITTISTQAPNHAPVAANDTRQTSEDTPLTIAVADLLANDTDLDGNALTVTGVSQGAKGTVKLADGKITYTPNPNVNGTDTFTYTVSDGQGGQSTATVTVTVGPVNDEPGRRSFQDPGPRPGGQRLRCPCRRSAGRFLGRRRRRCSPYPASRPIKRR